MPKFARVSVNIAAITEDFDYSIPAEFEPFVRPGSLVIVPFGRQLVQAIVLHLIDIPSVAEVKPIESLVDREPALTQAQLDLAERMSDTNFTSLAENLDQMLPPGISQHSDTFIRPNPGAAVPADLTPLQQRLLKTLTQHGAMRGRQLDAALHDLPWRESLPGLIKRGLVSSEPILQPPSVHPRTLRNAQLLISPAEAEQRIAQNSKRDSLAVQHRRNVITVLARESGPTNVSMVYAESGAVAADLKWLADLGILSLGESEVWRDPLEKLPPFLQQAPRLTEVQDAAWQVLQPQLSGQSEPGINLLIGVTGSGKTEIYLHAVADVLAQGKSVIVLVPEISLTPQTVRRFSARFPQKVGLIHSKLSPGERYDTWRRVRAGELPLVIGARSALFAPMPNLGLIILDECHDESYFQDDFPPQYSAVETAVCYAQMLKIPLLLGSATPTVEQLYRCRREGWQELHLSERILAHQEQPSLDGHPGTLPLPPVEIVDMRSELKAGNRTVLSRSLAASLQETLDNHEQAILFLNRRGSATFVFCRDCGYVLRCPRCDTQLTYHAAGNQLLCHICNYRRNLPTKCPQCGGKNIRQFGLGTESLEKEVSERFPAARVLRWDADTARLKGAHDLILDHFTQHRADILIGTKMLAKGLDLPLVTLVGVVLADVSLNLPDYHAPERTFQLLSQVAGRAGRSGRGGKAIFQTYHPENYAIQAASLHDFNGFYEQELELRRKTGYPPFTRLIRLEFDHYQETQAAEAARICADNFTHWANELQTSMQPVIGPVPCFYARRNGKYRWQVLLRGQAARELLKKHPLQAWQPHGVDVKITVDPPDIL